MDDIFDNDMDTGETMIAMPRNWNLTFHDVNEGKFRLNRLTRAHSLTYCKFAGKKLVGRYGVSHSIGGNGVDRMCVGEGAPFRLARGPRLSLVGNF